MDRPPHTCAKNDDSRPFDNLVDSTPPDEMSNLLMGDQQELSMTNDTEELRLLVAGEENSASSPLVG